MEPQSLKKGDQVELHNGKEGVVLKVDESKQECEVRLMTADGLTYERTLSINHVKKIG